MNGDVEQEHPGAGSEPAATEPTITAGYIARWTDASGPHPGECKKSVIRESYIEPARADKTGLNNIGFSLTLTESFVPDATARYSVRWRGEDHDETETFTSRADALAYYERRIRDFRASAEAPDGRSPV